MSADLCVDCAELQATCPVELLDTARDICARCGIPLPLLLAHGEPTAPVAPLSPPSPLEAAALAFCEAIRPGGGLPSVADLCEAAATFRAARGGAS